jgi:TIR domain.
MIEKSYDFFLSYSRNTYELIAKSIVNELEGYGIRIWFDKADVILGCNVHEHLNEVLINSTKWYGAIIIFDTTYFKKKWCLKELDFFLDANVPIIPIYYCLKKEDIPDKYINLNEINRISIFSNADKENAINKILCLYVKKSNKVNKMTLYNNEIWDNLVYNYRTTKPNSINSLIAADNIALFLQYYLSFNKHDNSTHTFILINIVHQKLLDYYRLSKFDIYDQKLIFSAVAQLIQIVN